MGRWPIWPSTQTYYVSLTPFLGRAPIEEVNFKVFEMLSTVELCA